MSSFGDVVVVPLPWPHSTGGLVVLRPQWSVSWADRPNTQTRSPWSRLGVSATQTLLSGAAALVFRRSCAVPCAGVAYALPDPLEGLVLIPRCT